MPCIVISLLCISKTSYIAVHAKFCLFHTKNSQVACSYVSVSPWEAFSPHQKVLSPVKQANRQRDEKKKKKMSQESREGEVKKRGKLANGGQQGNTKTPCPTRHQDAGH